MTEAQKKKRKVRASKQWRLKKLSEKKRAKGLDEITLKPLRKGWQLHHENLNEADYGNLDNDNFLCCNRKTHDFIHWLFIYYLQDVTIIDRIKKECKKMKSLI